VRQLAVEPEVVRRIRQVRGDDVPADPALGEVVERRHAAGERERRLVRRREGRAEVQALRDRGHRRDEQQRVEVGALQSLTQGSLGSAAEHVVGADDVGEEDAVEAAVLENLRQLGPVLDLGEPVPVVLGQRPQAVRDVADAGHLEEVEEQLLGLSHQRAFLVGASTP
jgi:hypothetical protein